MSVHSPYGWGAARIHLPRQQARGADQQRLVAVKVLSLRGSGGWKQVKLLPCPTCSAHIICTVRAVVPHCPRSVRQMMTAACQVELFEREAQALQGLSHPRIPQYVEYFEIDTPSDRLFCLVQVSSMAAKQPSDAMSDYLAPAYLPYCPLLGPACSGRLPDIDNKLIAGAG